MSTSVSSPAAVVPPETEPTSVPVEVAAVLPGEHWDEAPDDYDDDLAVNDVQSSTASITSSILNYRTFKGRTYHSDRGTAQYWGSNDGRHSDSLDMFYHATSLLLDEKLHLAPVENPKKVLDIGTGTGIWAIDFADAHPETIVIGTDVSPIQPTWVPPNLIFEIEDCTQPWTFTPGSFDFVHMQFLVGSIPDWYALFREAYTALEPGGYLESFESSPLTHSDDGSMPANSANAQWGPIFFQGGDKIGRTARVIEDDIQVKAMEAAGFVDIQVTNFKCPSGIWPKDKRQREIGELIMYSVLNDVEGWILFMSNTLGWTLEQIMVYTAHLRREFKKGEYHCYIRQRVVYGRKPKV
ncbi:methyltransferase type 11 [Grosmannia clavigera kw1407]|uniref:Methyltransferase type 11 n=1 Tax=Grosmannia clavigera (strain kw1407 / UAMH 11150) TaxID=655863 RepID=F0X736_GROCL|nr:methyltransferase type 11 [Grosmannia clavigera kw1407]EFX06413.1 methyltransferase type 11 [Grosmannia clavigera kw1407]